MSRRLPIYFLIDVSESMVGEQITAVEEGISTVIRELKTDPYALETAHISIIVFAGKPKTLVPLTDIITFYPPKFSIGGGTNLGDGLGQLMYEMRKNTIATTADKKGDWKPIVFLFTDGVPTDDTRASVKEWKQNWASRATMIAISLGDKSGLQNLNELTETVYLLSDTNASTYKSFFKWVTASIKTSSISIADSGVHQMSSAYKDEVQKIDISKDHTSAQSLDPNFAVFIAKCQNTKKDYLIKYQKKLQTNEWSDSLGLETLVYRLNGAYLVNNEYYELSSNTTPDLQFSTENLEGFPACPCCGNQFGISVCTCKKIHCTGNEKITTCPWCGNKGEYGFGSGPIDLNRNLG
jgi:uncharacterized protein YegL